ncbi:MAG: ABC transporter ATP-binding protein [Candidatus Eremiobacteraeota bacterium]|nr:ABC transporter ATP-binding protein [Candidatus Eremiobacteraeota bacterium]
MNVIEATNLTRTYVTGEVSVTALKGVDIILPEGDFVAIMGPSGSGKSTTMNLLGCLDRPTAGSYKLDGVEVSQMSADQLAEIRNLKIGFVFQGFNLLARTTALENVELPLLYREQEIPAKERKERSEASLSAVGLGHRYDHVPTQLSGGEQQRVAIARALVTQPSLVLADEPTGNLDSKTSVEVMRIFQELNEQKNITILLVTHEPDIAQYAKRVITFKDGKIKSDEPQKKRLIAREVLKTLEDEDE